MPLSPETLLLRAKLRRSYRKFLPEPVDRAVLETCLLTASTAPSGANKQPWHFCVVTDPGDEAAHPGGQRGGRAGVLC